MAILWPTGMPKHSFSRIINSAVNSTTQHRRAFNPLGYNSCNIKHNHYNQYQYYKQYTMMHFITLLCHLSTKQSQQPSVRCLKIIFHIDILITNDILHNFLVNDLKLDATFFLCHSKQVYIHLRFQCPKSVKWESCLRSSSTVWHTFTLIFVIETSLTTIRTSSISVIRLYNIIPHYYAAIVPFTSRHSCSRKTTHTRNVPKSYNRYRITSFWTPRISTEINQLLLNGKWSQLYSGHVRLQSRLA